MDYFDSYLYFGNFTMATKYTGGNKKKSKSKVRVDIPIYYRLPGGSIEIITGYLEKESLPEDEDSKRFFGHFQCKKCRQRWNSGYTWQGYQQECKKCELYEWPNKVYHLEGPQDDEVLMKKPHLSSLCEKCQKDGVHCLTGAPIKPDSDEPHKTELHDPDGSYSHHNKHMVHFEKQFSLENYNITIESNFIQEIFDNLWDVLSREDKSTFKDALKITMGKWRKKGREDLAIECREVLDQTLY